MKFNLLFLLIFLFSPTFVFAQVPVTPLAVPFGGPILGVYECTCSGGLLVLIEDFRTKLPLPLLYQPLISRLNQNFNIVTPGVMTVGSFSPGAVCSMGTTACFPVPVLGMITSYPFSGVGTGAVPMFLGN